MSGPALEWKNGHPTWGERSGGSYAKAGRILLRVDYHSAARSEPRGYRATIPGLGARSVRLFESEAEARRVAERILRRWLLQALSALGSLGPALAALEAAEGYADADSDAGARNLRALIDAARSSLDPASTGAPGLPSGDR